MNHLLLWIWADCVRCALFFLSRSCDTDSDAHCAYRSYDTDSMKQYDFFSHYLCCLVAGYPDEFRAATFKPPGCRP